MRNDTLDGTPVTTDSTEHARLIAAWERLMDVVTFNEELRKAGYTPPDERPGWMAVRETGTDGEDVGLVWAEPFDDED